MRDARFRVPMSRIAHRIIRENEPANMPLNPLIMYLYVDISYTVSLELVGVSYRASCEFVEMRQNLPDFDYRTQRILGEVG